MLKKIAFAICFLIIGACLSFDYRIDSWMQWASDQQTLLLNMNRQLELRNKILIFRNQNLEQEMKKGNLPMLTYWVDNKKTRHYRLPKDFEFSPYEIDIEGE